MNGGAIVATLAIVASAALLYHLHSTQDPPIILQTPYDWRPPRARFDANNVPLRARLDSFNARFNRR